MSNFRALVVEDNAVQRLAIKTMLMAALKKYNYAESETTIFEAESDEQVGNVLQQHNPSGLNLLILNGSLLDDASGARLFIKLCKVYSNTVIEAITVGWSASISDLKDWNKEIKDQYDKMEAKNKPVDLPVMRLILKKPPSVTELEIVIKTLIEKKQLKKKLVGKW